MGYLECGAVSATGNAPVVVVVVVLGVGNISSGSQVSPSSGKPALRRRLQDDSSTGVIFVQDQSPSYVSPPIGTPQSHRTLGEHPRVAHVQPTKEKS